MQKPRTKHSLDVQQEMPAICPAAADVALKAAEVARMTGVSIKTLANWRCLGQGPAFLKFGEPQGRGAVRYSRSVVLQWIADQSQNPHRVGTQRNG